MELLNSAETEEITKVQLHSYAPFLNSYAYNDEIRITCNSSSFIQLNKSFLYLRIKLGKLPRAETKITFVRNALLHLFSDVKLEQNGVLIEWSKLPGLTNTVFSYLTADSYDDPGTDEYQWKPYEMSEKSIVDFTIPLSRLLNFAKDYKKFMIYSRFDLILIRARSDLNCLYNKDAVVSGADVVPDNPKIEIERIKWCVPHLELDDVLKLKMLKVLENGRPIHMNFRTIDVNENHGIPSSTSFSWSVKSSIHRPTYAIACFQTDRNFQLNKDNSVFDHLDVQNIRLWVNQNVYPFEPLDLDFASNKFSMAYKMYKNTRESLCFKRGAPMDRATFKDVAPLFCFDLSHWDSNVKDSVIDIRLECEFLKAPPAKTACYLFLMYENTFSYNPFNELVLKEL